MIRNKTHHLPLICALFATAAIPVNAQVKLAVSSKISYRQNKNDIKFTGGVFDTELLDGSASFIGGCEWFQYYPPGYYNNLCSPGTSGLISSGSIEGVKPAYPYVIVTSIYPALYVAPEHPQNVKLVAAPPSGLPRPAGGFKDKSYSLFYNLTTPGSISPYAITDYFKSIPYTSSQREKFQNEVVPGTYYYSFPRLGDPDRSLSISSVIYPMLEGQQEINHTVQGFIFTDVNGTKWNKDGFVELSYLRPNSFNWKGAIPSTVFAAVDNMYFSIKVIQDPKNSKSPVVEAYGGSPISIFPPYQNGADPRVQLVNPYVTSFITPPIFDSGTSGVAQIQLLRNLQQTGGVAYDFSTRTFQIPVVVVDRYSEYVDITFLGSSSKGTDILSDPDNDGYNNLNEWILGSNATSSASIPVPPRPAFVTPAIDPITLTQEVPYFGFDVSKKLGTIPDVAYTLQRSKDGGKTWSKFVTDADWSVDTVRAPAISYRPAKVTIQVRSLVYNAGIPIQPPGTVTDIYRVKITLVK